MVMQMHFQNHFFHLGNDITPPDTAQADTITNAYYLCLSYFGSNTNDPLPPTIHFGYTFFAN